ncbi:hypothetical protein ACIBCN_01720 [Nocardia sp. NPDC051052]|uniref:hypothetical protein n=1 Tax=Nocardia sp. NPDC051052 TaxID=3364322 RepID=UPI00378E12E2
MSVAHHRDEDEISGDQFIERWYEAAARPKPNKKEFIAELGGWSGRLGECDWVRRDYGPRPAELARSYRKKALHEPEHRKVLSRLYATYVEPFSRFTGQYAAVAYEYRPIGLPDGIGQQVRILNRKVPPMVRAVVAGPRMRDIGGAIDARRDADGFLGDIAGRYGPYETVALRSYGSMLLETFSKLEDPDAEVAGPLLDRIGELSRRFGDLAEPPREPTADEKQFVRSLLDTVIATTPEVKDNPYCAEAYARATKTLLCWVVQGRGDIHAAIFYKHLEWARKDDLAATIRHANRERSLDDAALARIDSGVRVDNDAPERVRLTAAYEELVAYAEADDGSVSWEKALAMRILDEGLPASDARGSIENLVTAAWRTECPAYGASPSGAATSGPATAATYVRALLIVAAAAARASDHPETFQTATATARVAHRLEQARKLLNQLSRRTRRADPEELGR